MSVPVKAVGYVSTCRKQFPWILNTVARLSREIDPQAEIVVEDDSTGVGVTNALEQIRPGGWVVAFDLREFGPGGQLDPLAIEAFFEQLAAAGGGLKCIRWSYGIAPVEVPPGHAEEIRGVALAAYTFVREWITSHPEEINL